jgi:hypothetical protein
MTVLGAEQQLQALLNAVTRARAALAGGADVDVTGLDEAVAEGCRAAEDSDRTLRPAILSVMAALKAELDALSADLARQHATANLKRATAAYGGEPST